MKYIWIGLVLAVGACDDGADRDATVNGECGYALVEVSGARQGTLQIGDTSLAGQGACIYGRLADDPAASLNCIVHDPSGGDLISGLQLVMHIESFAFGPRTWVIDDHVSTPGWEDGDPLSFFSITELELGEETTVDAFTTGQSGDSSCVVDLIESSKERVGGSIECQNLRGTDDAAIDLTGEFCFERLVPAEA